MSTVPDDLRALFDSKKIAVLVTPFFWCVCYLTLLVTDIIEDFFPARAISEYEQAFWNVYTGMRDACSRLCHKLLAK